MKAELKQARESFNKFLVYLIRDTTHEVEADRFFDFMNEIKLAQKTRSERREYKKDVEYNKKILKSDVEYLGYLKNVEKVLNDADYSFDTEDEFKKLLYILTLYRLVDKTDMNYSKLLFSFYVYKSKIDGCTLNFLNYFDENGEPIKTKIKQLNDDLANFFKKYKKPTCVSGLNILNEDITYDLYRNTLISDQDIIEANKVLEEERKKRVEMKAKEDLIKKQQSENEKKKQITLNVTNINTNTQNITTYVKRNKENNKQFIMLEKYINYNKGEIKQDAYNKYSVEEFEKGITEPKLLTRAEINKYVESFKKGTCDIRIKIIYEKLKSNKQELIKLKRLVPVDYFTNPECMKLKDFLLYSDFKSKNDSELKNMVISFIDQNTKVNNNIEMQNYIIFSEEGLMDKVQNTIYSSRTHENKDLLIKKMENHLSALKNIDINELKANKDKPFHGVKFSCSSEQYVIDGIDGKLKLYRYGADEVKIVYAILSVNEENQKKLQEFYKTNAKSYVYLVVGAGCVPMEKEAKMYDRIMQYATDNKDMLLGINDLFSKPFTNETFIKACDLIDNGFIQIASLNKESDKNLVLNNK